LADIRARLNEIRARIGRAAARAGRTEASVRLVAVSKAFPIGAIREACDAGQRDFGENRVQEALQKIAAAGPLDVCWHLVGHLQSNKARKAAELFGVIHSIDSADLLARVDAAAAAAGRRPALLVQVDLAGEATKHGARPEELEVIFDRGAGCAAARITGLMLLPPFADNPEDSRRWFRRLRDERDRLLATGVPAPMLAELSMGMSHDFEVAIEEGATMVRIGTAIFGARLA
jgi:hypothetical protein